ncbi:MAG: hypothetical protein WBB07_19095 [Mycobacterium sp.]
MGAGRGALALALLALVTSACGSEPPPDVDELRAQLALATDDSELARTVAQTAPRELVPTLTQIAGERSRHAQALADEISRTLGSLVPATPTPTTSSTETTSSPTPPVTPPSVADLSDALRTAATRAADYAVRESGYRAGLLGSIAASCTTAYTVALPPRRAAQ